MAIYFLIGFLLTGLVFLICMLMIECGKRVGEQWLAYRAIARSTRAPHVLSRQSGQIALSGAVSQANDMTPPAISGVTDSNEGNPNQRTRHNTPGLYEKAFPIPEAPTRPSLSPAQLPDDQRTGPPLKQRYFEESPPHPLSHKAEVVTRDQPIEPVVRSEQTRIKTQNGDAVQTSADKPVGKPALLNKKDKEHTPPPPKSVSPAKLAKPRAPQPRTEPPKRPTAATPKAATPWLQDFFTQLAELARSEKCFIFNPNKEIVAGTIRLEVGEPALTHTGWGMNESRAWLEFYSANPAKAASDVPENNRRFKRLKEHKAAIEKAFGEPLDWDYDEGRKHQKVVSRAATKATNMNRKAWPKIQADLIDRATRLNAALKPYLAGLDDPPAPKRLDVPHARPKASARHPFQPNTAPAPTVPTPNLTWRKTRPAGPVVAPTPDFDLDELKI